MYQFVAGSERGAAALLALGVHLVATRDIGWAPVRTTAELVPATPALGLRLKRVEVRHVFLLIDVEKGAGRHHSPSGNLDEECAESEHFTRNPGPNDQHIDIDNSSATSTSASGH
ncbi:MAG: hypothetical protein ACYTEX_10920, partial [Planctomycetota bacterium]